MGKSFEELKLAAEQGDAESQILLGAMCFEGVKKNRKEAAGWYRKAAEQGHAEAQAGLGMMYYNGWGVKQNKQEAMKWYYKSAEQQCSRGQFFLGTMYHHGWGVKQNKQEAVKWYRKAAEQGDADAQLGLGGIYSEGESVIQKIKNFFVSRGKQSESKDNIQDYRQSYMWYLLAEMNSRKGDVGGMLIDVRRNLAAFGKKNAEKHLTLSEWREVQDELSRLLVEKIFISGEGGNQGHFIPSFPPSAERAERESSHR